MNTLKRHLHKLKSLFRAIVSLFIVFNVLGCDTDPYAGQRLLDYDNSTWVCETPLYIYIEYAEHGDLVSAYIESDVIIEIQITYGLYDDTIVISDVHQNALFKVHAVYQLHESTWVVYESSALRINVDDTFILHQIDNS